MAIHVMSVAKNERRTRVIAYMIRIETVESLLNLI